MPQHGAACDGAPSTDRAIDSRPLGRFPNGRYGLDALSGSSTLDQAQVDAHREIKYTLDSSVCLEHQPGDLRHCERKRDIAASEDGGSIGFSVGEWLASADLKLDDPNDLTAADQMGRVGEDGGMRRPSLRLTGLVLTVLISYANGQPHVGVTKQKIYANITTTKELLPWAGPGSVEKVHLQFPSGPYGAQRFHYIDR